MSDERPKSDAKRLFLAVNLSVASTRRVAEAMDRLRRDAETRGPRVTWVPPANLHVTLKFLGWTRPDAVGAIEQVVTAGVATRRGFEVEAVGGGAFPDAASARVVWVGVRDGTGALAQLAGDIEAWMERLGFAREDRAYHPHLTLGRVKEAAPVASLLQPVATQGFGISLIREVVLYESVTKSNGSEYISLFRAPLIVPERTTERQTRDVEGTSSPDSDKEEPDTHGGSRQDRT